MKRFLVLLSVLTLHFAATAQNVAIGERVPSMKKATRWLAGYKPEVVDFTFVEFAHSQSAPSVESVRYITEFARRCPDARVLVLTKESEGAVRQWMYDYAGGVSGVAVECGEVFEMFDINYAPFVVIIDSRRRVRWFGNPKTLTHERIVSIMNKTRKEIYGIH